MAKPDLERRVEVLEKVVAKGIFGGSDEEALGKWQEAFGDPEVEDKEPAPATRAKSEHIPIHANTTLHKTKK